MLPDFISNTIQERKKWCYNCDKCCMIKFKKPDFICAGIVEHPEYEEHRDGVKSDVIRICISKKGKVDEDVYTPDEALSIISVMTETIRCWLNDSESYKKFRKR